MNAAALIDDDEVPAVALGELVAVLFKRGLEGLRPVAGAEEARDLLLDILALDARAFFLAQLGARWRAIGTRNLAVRALTLGVGALDSLMAKAPFEVAGDFLMATVVMAVMGSRHRLDVDARPDHVKMLAPFLLMQHDDAGMVLKAHLLLQRIDRFTALLRRQTMRRLRADGRVIERLRAARA